MIKTTLKYKSIINEDLLVVITIINKAKTTVIMKKGIMMIMIIHICNRTEI